MAGEPRAGAAAREKLTPAEEKVIRLIANYDTDVYLSTICREFGINETRARVLLRPLFEGEFILERTFDYSIVLDAKGEDYAVKNGLA